MSIKHPIIAVTGSSGAGTTTVKRSFEHIFRREKISAAVIEGDSMHKYDRAEMKRVIAEAEARSDCSLPTHFGPSCNELAELESIFKTYAESGQGRRRFYLHNEDEAAPYGQQPGTFTAWENLPEHTDLLFYEGLHGAYVGDDADVAAGVDHPDHDLLHVRRHRGQNQDAQSPRERSQRPFLTSQQGHWHGGRPQ